MTPTPTPMRRARVAVALAAVALLGACGATADSSAPSHPSGSHPDATSGHTAGEGSSSAAAALPRAHVHGVGRDPRDGALLVATHEGLYRSGGQGLTLTGPTIDLMGFAVAGPGHYYASGHPNTHPGLPQPMGLIESTDAGRTWSVLSRGGQSDFHALTPAGDAVVGFDGAIRSTTDRRSWTTSDAQVQARALTSDPQGRTVLATTPRGLMASSDRGVSWAPVEGAPLLLHVAWAGAASVVGVAPDGSVAMSADAGRTWRMTGASVPEPQAVGASETASGLEVLVVTEREVLRSTDGRTFTPTSR